VTTVSLSKVFKGQPGALAAVSDLDWERAGSATGDPSAPVGPAPAAPRYRFWIIAYDGPGGLPPRVREVEAVPCEPPAKDKFCCRVVSGLTSTWHRLDREVLYEDEQTAELEAAEDVLAGKL
jgi:hypothetical protein